MGEIIGARELKSWECTQEGSKEVCLTHPLLHIYLPSTFLAACCCSVSARGCSLRTGAGYLHLLPAEFIQARPLN